MRRMKYVLLSADTRPSVYSVPDIVADNLKEYCLEFEYWLQESPHAANYRDGGFDETDFVRYLNEWVFPDQPSTLVKTLGWRVPRKYRNYERFNF